MKSSHSGMPSLSPAGAVLAVLLELPAAVLLLSVVSVLLHPIRMAAHRTAKIKKVFLNIRGTPSKFSGTHEPSIEKGIEKRRHDTREIENLQPKRPTWRR